jgi:hypothetical protein
MDIENTPRTLPKGSRDLRLLWVLRNFRLRMQTPKGIPKGSNDLRSHQVANCTTVLLLRKGKKRGGKSRSCAEHTSDQDRFRAGPLPDRVTSGQKGPTRSDIAQLPVAHTQNILPDMARDWRHFRSRHIGSCAMVRSTSPSTANNNWAVPIYYWHSTYTTDIIFV